MPIAFDPDSVIWFSLPSDADKPEPRPEFCARPMTVRQVDAYDDSIAEFRKAAEGLRPRDLRAKVVEFVGRRVTGFRNMPPGFNGLEDLTEAELYSLFYRLPDHLSMSEVDLKKSGSPSQSDTA